jgi:hypothetical protein
MENSQIDAYEEGRRAGSSHFRAVQQDAASSRPANPYPAASYWVGVEWGRGFHDGFTQCGRMADAAIRTAARS